MDIKYIAIDPGETCGFALYDKSGKLLWLEQHPLNRLITYLWAILKDNKNCVVICEAYRVYPQKAMDHIYSDLKTVKAIGRIEALCELTESKLVMQPATVKSTGFRWIGKKPSSQLKHQQDAHAHGIYYLVSNGIIDPAALL